MADPVVSLGLDPAGEQAQKLVDAGCLPTAPTLDDATRWLARQSLRPIGDETATRWKAFLASIDAPPEMMEQVDALRSAGACAVVAGQQAGVLSGPMMTIFKALRATQWARALAESSGRIVVPVFWIAGDDHDLAEIQSVDVINRDPEVQRLRLELGTRRAAASQVRVPDGVDAFLAEFERLTGSPLPDACRPHSGDNLTRWCARVLRHVLGSACPVPIEPSVVLADARPILQRVLDDPQRYDDLLAEGAEAVRQAGFVPPLEPDGSPPLFMITADDRRRVESDGDGGLRMGDQAWPSDALADVLGTEGPRLSPNASLRPLVQNATLPVAATVVGPTEMLYWAELGPLHDAWNVPYPVVAPRLTATVLSSKAMRLLRKESLEPESLDSFLDDEREDTAVRSLVQDASSWRGPFEAWAATLRSQHPSLERPLGRRLTQISQQMNQLLERMEAAAEEGGAVRARRRRTLGILTRPRGVPQDRVLNALPFLLEGGVGWLKALEAHTTLEAHRWVVSLDGAREVEGVP